MARRSPLTTQARSCTGKGPMPVSKLYSTRIDIHTCALHELFDNAGKNWTYIQSAEVLTRKGANDQSYRALKVVQVKVRPSPVQGMPQWPSLFGRCCRNFGLMLNLCWQRCQFYDLFTNVEAPTILALKNLPLS